MVPLRVNEDVLQCAPVKIFIAGKANKVSQIVED
jgi:hypothetical protein